MLYYLIFEKTQRREEPDMATRKYQGYQGYGKNATNSLNRQDTQDFTIDQLPSSPLLQEPVMNVDSLFNLAKFLESSQSDSSFPEVTVIPDLLRSVGKFVNERKKMKFAHQEFEKKLKFLSDGLDKQYHMALTKIEKETEIQLAQINGNIRLQLNSINRYYDLEMQRLLSDYDLRKEEINLYYQNLDAQRREQARRFDRMLKYATIERKKAQKAIKEADEITAFLKKKFYDNTATREEREHYMELLKFRIESVNIVTNIVPQLAACIK